MGGEYIYRQIVSIYKMEAPPKQSKEYFANYYKEHHEYYINKSSDYHELHRDAIHERKRLYHIANREKINERHRKYRLAQKLIKPFTENIQ